MTCFTNRLFRLAVILAVSLFAGQSVNATQPNQASGQASPSSEATTANSVKGHGPMPVELTKSLNSKKLKEGDPVMARITAELRLKDGTVIPRGSEVTGHVTEAKARSKGDPQSELGIIFDKISLPGGKDLPIKGAIQAVAPNPNAGAAQAGSSPGDGMMAGHEGSGTGTTPPPMPSLPTNQQTGRPVLNGQSKGVIGIHHLELGENSVLISTGKDVSLDSGTQMIIEAEIE
ncbi:MAG: hypothetical protein WCC92_05925 [Candidatus Korobacteraceae bacterium]